MGEGKRSVLRCRRGAAREAPRTIAPTSLGRSGRSRLLTDFLSTIAVPAVASVEWDLCARLVYSSRPANRRIEPCRNDPRGLHVEANVSAEQSQAQEDSWVPPEDADPRGSRHLGQTAGQGPGSAVRIDGPAPSGRSLRSGRTSRDRAVRRLLASARPVKGTRMVVFLAPGSGDVAFVAGRRVGGAVDRNRARRILRAAWRELAPRAEEGYDIAFVARAGIRGARTQDLVAEMEELLRGARVIRA
jgi:ribonuclease P protein component